MDNIKKLNINGASSSNNEYKPPIQSADTLFHFVEKLDYLLPIIERFALVPRYCVEDIDYLEINMHQLAYPMRCFCDINLHKMQEHIHYYGGDGYGIAFAKKWGIANCIQPIQYINRESPLRKDFTSAFNDAIQSDTTTITQDYLLTQMRFFKPLQGTMLRNNKYENRNFTDEREWRYVPDMNSIKLPQVICQDDLFSISIWNDALESAEQCWLKFQPDDIKYIILKTRDDFDELTKILDKKGLDSKTHNMLISKTIIWDEEKGDF